MRFQELTDQAKILAIKEEFNGLIESLAGDKNKLKDYVSLEVPKLIVPTMEKITDDLSDAEKDERVKRNNVLVEKVKADNAKLETDYKQRQESYQAIEKILSSLKTPETCMCGMCVAVDLANQPIPPELQPIVDAARKNCEAKSYNN